MVIAMVAVLVMKAPFNQIIDVVTMRHGLMAAVRAVNMVMIMANMVLDRLAAIGVFAGDFDDMFVDVIAMGMMKVSVMQIVDMIVMLDGNMSTASAVLMVVVIVMWKIAVAHEKLRLYSMMTGVVDGVLDQRKDMMIRDRIDGILPLTAPLHEPRCQKHF
jgi:hypothetical protein